MHVRFSMVLVTTLMGCAQTSSSLPKRLVSDGSAQTHRAAKETTGIAARTTNEPIGRARSLTLTVESAKPVTFTRRVPKTGDVRVERTLMSCRGHASVPNRAAPIAYVFTDTRTRRVTVLDADPNGALTRFRVRFTQYDITARLQGSSKDSVVWHPHREITKRVFLVDHTDGKRKVTATQGSKPTAAESALVIDSFRSSLTKSFGLALPTKKPIALGQKIFTKGQLQFRLIGLGSVSPLALTFTTKEMVFRGTRAVGGTRCGVFQVKLEGSTDSPFNRSVKLTGGLLLEVATTRIREFDVQGIGNLTGGADKASKETQIWIRQVVTHPKKR